jgi:radical SAM family protein
MRAFIDTIDACQLKCPTCVRGVRVMQNSSAKMSLEKFCAVLDRAKSEGYRAIGLYSWTEPFLNRTLQDYVLEVKKRDLECLISTTLSLRRIDNLEATLLAKPDLIDVSISGWDQATYQINHVGGNLSYVLANLEQAVSFVRSRGLTTTFQLLFIKFDYNASHEEPLRSHAAALGIRYGVTAGVGHPDSSYLRGHARSLTDDFIRKKMADAPEASPETCGKICGCMFDDISIDCHGDVYLCTAFPNQPSLRIGPYLDLSAQEILLRRWTHSFCKTCDMPRREATDIDKRRIRRAVAQDVISV